MNGQVPVAPDLSPMQEAIAREEKSHVAAALAELPERERQIVMLHAEHELPFERIGKLLGVSAAAAHKTWKRAIDRLRTKLENG
jgi:RNA polymerase sigma factor (sigma-70 family)